MTEILSPEEWLLASIFGESPPPETIASLHATIKALAEGLRLGVDEYWASADSNSDDFKDDAERELVNTLREKGWLDE